MAATHMELLCWRGAWGLPSVDSGCLIVMAYAHFSNAPVKLKKTGNPRESVTGCLPILKSGDETISKPLNILNCFRKEQYNADYDLSPKQGADTMAFVALIEEKLLPALLHTFWVDDQNYTGVTRPWYASTMPFPFNMFAPYRSSQQALTRLKLSVGRPPYMSLAEMEAQIYWDAKECLNLLSFQLGEKAFFFGEMPSSLDAVVFGHLAPLLKAPLLTKKLQLHLKAIENLCAFCERVLLRCFPGQAPDGRKPAGEPQSGAAGDVKPEHDGLHADGERSTLSFSASVSLAALSCLVVLSGLLSKAQQRSQCALHTAEERR